MWRARSSRRFNTGKKLAFVDHLEELRQRLLAALAALGVFSIAASFFSKQLLDFLTLPLGKSQEAVLYFQAPHDAFLTYLKVSLLAGVLAGSPVFFTQFWLFLAPGLSRKERKILAPLILVSIFLFLLGAAFAFWVILPVGLRFLLSFQTESLRPLLGAGPYFSFLIGMILACGAVFELPVAILGLVRLGVLTRKRLRGSRRVVIVSAFILAAVLTPTTDPLSQILLAVPLILLYEGCVLGAGWIEGKRR